MRKIVSRIILLTLVCVLGCLQFSCSSKKEQEALPEKYSEWGAENIKVSDSEILGTNSGKVGRLYNKGCGKNEVLEFKVKTDSSGYFKVNFGSTNFEDGYIVEYNVKETRLYVKTVSGSKKNTLYAKDCILTIDEWYTFRLEQLDNRVKIYFNDESNLDKAKPKIMFDINMNNSGVGITIMDSQVKDIYNHKNDNQIEKYESTFINPVDFASEPNVVYNKGVYYMYAKNGEGTGIDVYRSYDLIDWNNNGLVLKSDNNIGLAAFSYPSYAFYNNKSYLCYTADGKIAISCASAPDEQFVQEDKRFINDKKEQDGYLFIDDNKAYMAFVREEDGTNNIYGAELNNTLTSFKQETIKLLVSNAFSPSLYKENGKTYLLYCTNKDNSSEIMYRSASEVLGEYSTEKLLISGNKGKGFASASIVKSFDNSENLMVYQDLDTNGIFVDRIFINDTQLNANAPTNYRQEVPSGVKRIMHVGDLETDSRTRKNDLSFAINLAAENISGSLDFDNHYFPVWNANITSNGNAIFSNGWHGHNIGRWMDAMYRYQEYSGTTIEPFLKNVMLNNTKWFFSNPDGICLQPNVEKNGTFFELHSLREGMAALNSIIKNETGEWHDWALDASEKMIAKIDSALNDNMQWDFTKFEYRKTAGADLNNYYDSCGSSGRFCEMLMQNYDITHSEQGLKLAKRIVDYNYNNSTTAEGKINYASKPNHTHSFQNTLQAMLRYGKATGEKKYIDRVEIMFRNTIQRLVSPSGVVNHDLESGAQGWETSSSSDALQLAMWLVDEGYTQYADFAERMLRARLLPAQFVEGDKLVYSDNESGLSWQIPNRVNGGYSMLFDGPYSGKFTTTDVTCHVQQALIDAYNHITFEKNGSVYYMYHFDNDNKNFKSSVSREDVAKLDITVKTNKVLYVRIPQFATTVSVKKNGAIINVVKDDIFVKIDNLDVDDKVEIEFDLPKKETKETHSNNITYTIKWSGDEIIGVSPKSTFFPMFK